MKFGNEEEETRGAFPVPHGRDGVLTVRETCALDSRPLGTAAPPTAMLPLAFFLLISSGVPVGEAAAH